MSGRRTTTMAERLELACKMADNLLQAAQAIERDLPQEGPAFDFAQQARSHASSCFEAFDDALCMQRKSDKKGGAR